MVGVAVRLAGAASPEPSRDRRVTTAESRLHLVLDAAGMGTWEWDVRSGETFWDERCAAMFGIRLDEFEEVFDGFASRTHPDDLPAVQEALQRAVTEVGSLEIEYRAVRPDGTVRWLLSRGQALAGPEGTAERLLGVVVDVTDRHDLAETRMAEARRIEGLATVALRLAAAETVEDVLQVAVRDGFAVLGASGGALAVPLADGQNLRVLTLADAQPGTPVETNQVPWDDSLPVGRAAGTGEPVLLHDPAEVADRFPAAGDLLADAGVAAVVALPLHVAGRTLGALRISWPTPRRLHPSEVEVAHALAAQCAQTLDRVLTREVERETTLGLKRSQARLSLIAEATSALAATLDVEESLVRLVHLVVPLLADWAVVHLLDPDGTPVVAAARHRDGGVGDLLERIRALPVGQTPAASPFSQALRGESVLLEEVDPSDLAQVTSPEGFALVTALGVRSAMVVPLAAQDRVLGAMVLVASTSGRLFTNEDLQVASDLGRRAGLTIENARLYDQVRRTSETLQRSLLTRPPEPDHLELTVRYLPAAEQVQVGGDWYDAFLQPDGATVLVIGDVVGHDVSAAASMGQVRTLVRALAYDRQETPSRVLTRVDRAMRGLDVTTLATALIARVEQDDDLRARSRRRLRWSNAGHLPPVLLHADGSVETLDAGPADLLLGLDPSSPRRDATAEVPPGGTLLLFTDGLVERRDSPLDAGLDRLRAALRDLPGLTLEELCDELLARLLPDTREDDVALVAVRAHPEDRPRPPEAGPQTAFSGDDPFGAVQDGADGEGRGGQSSWRNV